MKKGRDKDSKSWNYDNATLQQVYVDLLNYSIDQNDKQKDIVIERIRLMAEIQIWGEKNNDSFFDFFCERNVPELLLKILKNTKSRDIVVQIIQSLSMLLTNISKPVNLNFILSNNAINEFIMHDFDFNDEEIVDFYISFLKSISLRLGTNPLQLFYNEKYNNFPLLSQAIRFYNHKEAMVRTTVQNITLAVFKIKEPKLQAYLTNFPFVIYFVNISCWLKDLWIKIDEEMIESSSKNYSRLKELLDDQYDMLMYMEDVFTLGNENINKILANAFLSYAIIPTLIGAFTTSKKGYVSLNLALYLLNVIFQSITYSPILELIFIYLLSPTLTQNMINFINDPINIPSGYTYKWTFRNFWDNYSDYIKRQAIKIFQNNQIAKASPTNDKSSNENGSLSPIKQELSSPTSPLLSDQTNNNKNTTNDKEEKSQDMFNLENEHMNMSKALGLLTDDNILINIDKDIINYSPIIMLEIYKSCFDDLGELTEANSIKPNPWKNAFIYFFTTKDDNMILLMTCIMYNALNSMHISLKMFSICDLVIERKDKNKQSLHTPYHDNCLMCKIKHKHEEVITILKFLTKLLIVDPPFRIGTCFMISKLIMDIAYTSDGKMLYPRELLTIFNEGYKNSIGKLMKLVQNPNVTDYFIELYENQWKDIYKNDSFNLERRSLIFALIPIADDANAEIEFIMRYPSGKHEITKREISIFLIFRKLRYYLFKESKYSRNTIEFYQSKFDKMNASNQWEEGKLYEIDIIIKNCIDQRKLLPCYIKKADSKQQCYIAEDDENFIIITPDYSKLYWAKIIYNIKLKHVEALIDRSDPRILNIFIKSSSNHKDKHEILSFDDHTLCLAAKITLDESKRFSRSYELTLLSRSFENAMNDIIEYQS